MRRTFLSLCLAGLLTAFASAPAAAATLRIEFDNFDVAYDGQFLTDSNTVDTGFFQVDALRTMDFFLDGNHVGSLSSNIYADLAIGVNGSVPAAGGTVDGYFGLFTLFTSSSFNSGVAVLLDEIHLIFQPLIGPMVSPRLALAGVATGNLLEQALLPFNVEFDPSETIEVLFIVNLANIETNKDYITSFTGTGTGSVQSEVNVVPEPTSLMLLGTGLLGAAGMRRRAARNSQAA